MYGLPPNFNPDVMVGQVLEMICFAQADVYFHFGEDITITAGGNIEFNRSSFSIPIKEANFICLIGRGVIAAETNQRGDLILNFEGEDSLSILDSESNFESYSIKIGEKTIFV